MSPDHIVSYQGRQDGIRFGTMVVQGVVLTYRFDKLNMRVRLWKYDNTRYDKPEREDSNPARLAAAMALCQARAAVE